MAIWVWQGVLLGGILGEPYERILLRCAQGFAESVADCPDHRVLLLDRAALENVDACERHVPQATVSQRDSRLASA